MASWVLGLPLAACIAGHPSDPAQGGGQGPMNPNARSGAPGELAGADAGIAPGGPASADAAVGDPVRTHSTTLCQSGCTAQDAGTPSTPRTTVELCSIAIAYEDSGERPLFRLNLGSSLGTDAEGNLYLAGSHRGTIDLGGEVLGSVGLMHGFIAKYDASCRHVWSRSWGAISTVLHFNALAVGSSGELVVAGLLAGPIEIDGQLLAPPRTGGLLLSFEAADGSLRWGDAYSSPYEDTELFQVGVDAAGDITFSGFGSGDLPVGGQLVAGPEGLMSFLAKVSSTGEHRFGYEAFSTFQMNRLAVHPDGMIAVTSLANGSGVSSIDFGPDSFPLDLERQHRFVAVLDPQGALSWGQLLDRDVRDVNGSEPGSIVIDRDGHVIVEHGDSYGSVDEPEIPERVSKLDARGTLVWSQAISPAGWHADNESVGNLAVDSEGNLLHTDLVDNLVDAPDPEHGLRPSDVLVQKLSPNGAGLWQHVLSVDVFDQTWGLAVGPDGSVWVGHGRHLGLNPLTGELRITKLAP